MRYDCTISDYFPVITREIRGVFLPQYTLQHWLGSCTGKDVGGMGLRSFIRNSPDHWSYFANDVVILAATTEVLAGALDSLSMEVEPLCDCEFH